MASKSIRLSGQPNEFEQLQCSAAVTPGELVEISSGKWRKHAGAGKNAAPVFVKPRDEMGSDIDIAYATNDYVKVDFFHVGERVNGWVASGQNISAGAYVESDGSGGLRALTTDAATDDTQRRSVVAMAYTDTGAVTVRSRHPFIVV